MRPLFKVAILMVLLTLLGVLLYPYPSMPRYVVQRTACLSNVKQLARGFEMYAADADGRFPLAKTWTDRTMPYLKKRWPLARALRCPNLNEGSFGYAFNAPLSGQKMPDHPETVPLVFESTSNLRNVADDFASFPRPGRHGGKNTLAYADGHAKTLNPDAPGPH